MMTTAIPARLEFQCGHAALVSLPRIKGETSAQRQERIAGEKAQAQMRQCDFCSPTLVLDSSAAQSTHATMSGTDNGRQEVFATVQSNGTAPTSSNDAAAPVKRGPGRPRKNPLPTSNTAPASSSAASTATTGTSQATAKRRPGRPRKNPLPTSTASTASTPAAAKPAASAKRGSSSTGRKAATAAAPRRRGRRPGTASNASPTATSTAAATRGRYTVRYVVEEVVVAANVGEALRSVESRRGGEVVSINSVE